LKKKSKVLKKRGETKKNIEKENKKKIRTKKKEKRKEKKKYTPEAQIVGMHMCV
jgi:hypothetical protein